MPSQRPAALVVALAVGVALGGLFAFAVVSPPDAGTDSPNGTDQSSANSTTDWTLSGDPGTVSQFEDRAAFRSYVAAGQRQQGTVYARFGGRRTVTTANMATERPTREFSGDSADSGSQPDRIAETNVQVGSLDEPDRVKTDGQHFYYAPEIREYYYEPEPRATDDVARKPPKRSPETHVIDASDPTAPAVLSHINTSGKLLQTGDTLVVFEQDRVAGYDVSDPESPTEAWSHPLNGSMVTARSANGTVYLVTESSVAGGSDCPIRPLGSASVACSDIYRPGGQIPVDSTYTALSIDASDGTVRDSVSFVGTSEDSVVYMSPDALYVTYTQRADRAKLLGSFVREEFDRTPARVDRRVAEIQSYNITSASKIREIRTAVQRWVRSLPADEREAARTAFREQLASYLAENRRNLTTTGIVRVDVDGTELSVESTGTVPGEPLNQFSLDQHDGTLRIATTIPRTGDAKSANDLYTLDADTLARQGSVTGMGDDQRVYAVRYVGDTAYVVTFRQVDPLHVVDLSDPTAPVETGTLELPGYSSYLHPIDDDTILGIGEEDGQVKAVLFDVSDPQNPTIADSKVFDEHYSAVSETHHAFLIDRRHGVFVLPTGDQALAVNYTDGELTTEATIDASNQVSRTRYVEDSLYVFAGDSLTVVDETDWSTTTTLSLDSTPEKQG